VAVEFHQVALALPETVKSFLLLFFKKEDLLRLSKLPAP
jgi:hypothetical protein